MPDSRRKVELEFPNIRELIDFTLIIDNPNCQIIRSKCLLISELTDAEIELAITGYKAKLIGLKKPQ